MAFRSLGRTAIFRVTSSHWVTAVTGQGWRGWPHGSCCVSSWPSPPRETSCSASYEFCNREGVLPSGSGSGLNCGQNATGRTGPMASRDLLTEHLLRRIGFGAAPGEVDRYAELGYATALDRLINYEFIYDGVDDLIGRSGNVGLTAPGPPAPPSNTLHPPHPLPSPRCTSPPPRQPNIPP